MRIRRIIGAGVLLFAGALLLTACSSNPSVSSSSKASTTASAGTHIVISNFMFMPMQLTVSPGATITVTNDDSATHTLTATGGQFDTGNIVQGETASFKAPTAAGTYHYICSIHQFMTGSIIVR
jgi:plastocyanin